MRAAVLASCLILMQTPVALLADDCSDSATARALMNQLETKDEKKRNEIIERLSRLGDGAMPTLIEGLADPNQVISRGCKHALSKMGNRALPALTKALSADNSRMRRAAVWALAGLNGDRSKAVPPLISALSHEDPDTRASAVRALVYVRDTRAIVPLTFALSDDHEDVRLEAVVAFENFGAAGSPALPTLFLMLREIPKYELHLEPGCNIRGALAEIGSAAIPPTIHELRRQGSPRELKQLLLSALARMAQEKGGKEARPALPYLIELLKTKEEKEVKEQAIDVLREMGEPARNAVPILKKLTLAEEASTRVEAAYALCWIDSASTKKYIGPIIAGLSDSAVAVRSRALACLRQLASDAAEAIPSLLNTLKDQDAIMRRDSCTVLGAIGERALSAIPTLTEVAGSDADMDVRKAARDAIASIRRK